MTDFDKNLLVRLDAKRSSEEDFFTEAFAHLLNSNEDLLKRFIEWLFDKCGKEVDKNSLEGGLTVETQQSYLNNRPDIEISNNAFSLFIENKIEAGVDIEQINDYLKIQSNKENAYVILIIKYGEDADDIKKKLNEELLKNYLGLLYWREIYCFLWVKKLENYESDILKKYLLDQFLEFIKYKEIDPVRFQDPKTGQEIEMTIDEYFASRPKVRRGKSTRMGGWCLYCGEKYSDNTKLMAHKCENPLPVHKPDNYNEQVISIVDDQSKTEIYVLFKEKKDKIAFTNAFDEAKYPDNVVGIKELLKTTNGKIVQIR